MSNIPSSSILLRLRVKGLWQILGFPGFFRLNVEGFSVHRMRCVVRLSHCLYRLLGLARLGDVSFSTCRVSGLRFRMLTFFYLRS